MFDLLRLFRVLKALSLEENKFLICQDAYATLKSCIEQLNSLPVILEKFRTKVAKPKDQDAHERLIESLTVTIQHSPEILPILELMLAQAECILVACPYDDDEKEADWQACLSLERYHEDIAALKKTIVTLLSGQVQNLL